jgi:formyl-CoA transferase
MENAANGLRGTPASEDAPGQAYPLSGITVIDLSHVYNGPYATFLMAMAGANVIKVEPHGGEHLRSRGDMGGAALPFAMLNSNKQAVTLNLKTQRGKELLKEMVVRADILVENFAPGVMDRLGIGSATLLQINPRLIYGSSSGYGKTGPYKDYPAMDLVMQAMSGIMSITGYPDQPPVKAGAAVCDFSAGIHLYAAIMTALYQRERTGKGRVVEVAMQDASYASMASNLGMLHARGADAPSRTGNRHGGLGISPYNVWRI